MGATSPFSLTLHEQLVEARILDRSSRLEDRMSILVWTAMCIKVAIPKLLPAARFQWEKASVQTLRLPAA